MEPTLVPLIQQFRDTTRLYMRALSGVSHDALLTRPGPRLAFAAMHEAYHVGQMGYLRKWLGLDPIFDS